MLKQTCVGMGIVYAQDTSDYSGGFITVSLYILESKSSKSEFMRGFLQLRSCWKLIQKVLYFCGRRGQM